MKVVISGIPLNVDLCNTPESITEGMSGRNFSFFIEGMLFKMPAKTIHSFWTYKCKIALDIVFINSGIITKIYNNCAPCIDINNCSYYKGYGDYILELKGGFCFSKNINQGGVVEINEKKQGKYLYKSEARRANARSCTAVFKTS